MQTLYLKYNGQMELASLGELVEDWLRHCLFDVAMDDDFGVGDGDGVDVEQAQS